MEAAVRRCVLPVEHPRSVEDNKSMEDSCWLVFRFYTQKLIIKRKSSRLGQPFLIAPTVIIRIP